MSDGFAPIDVDSIEETQNTPEHSLDISSLQLSPEAMAARKKQLSEFILTPDELLSRRKLLQIREAAYILNISTRLVRNMISSGQLPHVPGTPIRIPTEAIRRLVEDCDIWESPEERRLDQKALELGLDR